MYHWSKKIKIFIYLDVKLYQLHSLHSYLLYSNGRKPTNHYPNWSMHIAPCRRWNCMRIGRMECIFYNFWFFFFFFFWVGKTTFIQEKLGNIKGTKAESIRVQDNIIKIKYINNLWWRGFKRQEAHLSRCTNTFVSFLVTMGNSDMKNLGI